MAGHSPRLHILGPQHRDGVAGHSPRRRVLGPWHRGVVDGQPPRRMAQTPQALGWPSNDAVIEGGGRALTSSGIHCACAFVVGGLALRDMEPSATRSWVPHCDDNWFQMLPNKQLLHAACLECWRAQESKTVSASACSAAPHQWEQPVKYFHGNGSLNLLSMTCNIKPRLCVRCIQWETFLQNFRMPACKHCFLPSVTPTMVETRLKKSSISSCNACFWASVS